MGQGNAGRGIGKFKAMKSLAQSESSVWSIVTGTKGGE